MKKLLTPLLLLVSFQLLANNGISFFEGSLQEAQEKAAKEHKIIFMDAYTSWCGPCKRMAQEVFSDGEVGKFYNKHFINIKVDMEKGEGPQLASKYRVNSYPTLLFLDDKGEVVHAAKGGRPIDQFIGLGKEALSKNDKSGDFEKEYEAGSREPALLRAYAYALLNSGKPSAKIANEYIKTQQGFNDPQLLEFLLDFANEADSKIFDLAVQNKDAIVKLKSEKTFNDKIRSACDATVDKAVEFKVETLLEDAKAKMKTANPAFYKEYIMLADMKYQVGMGNMEEYASLVDRYLSKYAKKDAATLNQYAYTFLMQSTDKKLLEKAEKWAKQATELDYNQQNLKTHIGLLNKLGRTKEAEEVMKKLEELGGAPATDKGH